MTPHAFILQLYNNLLDAGWRMKDIDEMDIIGYLEVKAFKANKEAKPKKVYIDQVWSDKPKLE